MAETNLSVRDGGGIPQTISATTDPLSVPAGALVPACTIADPVTGVKALVQTAGGLTVSGAAAQGAAIAGAPVLVGATFTTSPATITSGQAATLQTDNVQNLLTKINVALPAGTNAIGTVTAVGAGASAAALSGNPVRAAGSDGTNTQNLTTASAANQPINSAFTTQTVGALLTVKPGMWSVSADGAAGTGATAITTVSGAGKFQVIDSISCGVAADGTGAAQGVTECQVIHDAGGTPVILWRTGFSFPAGAAAAGSQVTVSGLSIVQPVANKAITINFVGATGNSLAVAAHTVSWVNMSGYVIG